MITLAAVRRQALRNLIPPPRLRLSEWIEHNSACRRASAPCPAQSGSIHKQREIADAISDLRGRDCCATHFG